MGISETAAAKVYFLCRLLYFIYYFMYCFESLESFSILKAKEECAVYWISITLQKRVVLFSVNALKKRERGGREGLRLLSIAASHHSPRSSLPQGRPATLTTAAPSTKPQALCEKGHFTSMLLKSPYVK